MNAAMKALQARPRVPNGHGYCWDENKHGQRCTLRKGHSGKHECPYTPRSEW